ncbi:MAG TPA: PfkB family carbohydrate kinase [Ktedonobacterales bacterium]
MASGEERGRWWLSAPDVTEQPVEALLVGHVSCDTLPEGGWRAGGSVYYAGALALRLGLRVGIVTSAPATVCERVCAELREAGEVALVAVPAEVATTFENEYTPAGRRQYLRARAEPITLEDIPLAWRRCAVALVAPVARELSPDLADGLTAEVIGATPQGWLRAWDGDGRVRPRVLDPAETNALRRYSALILSREDLAGVGADGAALAEAERTLEVWARLGPLLAVTCGPDGAEVWRSGRVERFPGFPATEVDPTGAGDVFAATFLCALAATHDPATAMDMANRVAALAVEGVGVAAIPTPERIAARYLPPTQDNAAH